MLNYESEKNNFIKKHQEKKPSQFGFTWLTHYLGYEIGITPQKKQTNQEAKSPIT